MYLKILNEITVLRFLYLRIHIAKANFICRLKPTQNTVFISKRKTRQKVPSKLLNDCRKNGQF